MPIYDYKCPKCGQKEALSLSVEDYETMARIMCKDCDTRLARYFSKETNVFARVVGTSKGNYNSKGDV